jgi:hypothetical protein
MKINFVTYCNEDYEDNRQRITKLAEYEFDQTFPYSPEDIEQDFYVENKNILEQRRGIGYWLWKPYIIQKTLDKIPENDIVFYLDSGDSFKRGLAGYLRRTMANHDMVLVPGTWPQHKFTKRDCFVFMNCDNEEYWNAFQVEAGIHVVKNNHRGRELIAEWLKWCKDENIITDIDNISGKNNFPSFIDHRHDQSIISNMAKKHNIFLDNTIRKWVTCNVVVKNA